MTLNPSLIRSDGRRVDEIRAVKITRPFTKYAEGSVLMEMGETKVICTASIEEKVPSFLRDKGQGWVTAEYSMLPRSTHDRTQREASRGKQGGRTLEIQRLVGRALRAVTDMNKLGERTVWIDCDVIQADGGTRTASITGSFIALADAVAKLQEKNLIQQQPLKDYLAAISVGKVKGDIVVDLTYDEDSTAEVDMNLVMTGNGRMVEVQGTAEGEPFEKKDLDAFITYGWSGIQTLIKFQREIVGTLS